MRCLEEPQITWNNYQNQKCILFGIANKQKGYISLGYSLVIIVLHSGSTQQTGLTGDSPWSEWQQSRTNEGLTN